jgi:hypothetical protein
VKLATIGMSGRPSRIDGADAPADEAGLRPLILDQRQAMLLVVGGLGVAVVLLVSFAILINPFDFSVYRWGSEVVTHGTQLYLGKVAAQWFTYPPFAAMVLIPLTAIPDAVARVGWELASLLALAWAATLTLKLAGYRPNWVVIGAVTVVSITLEPVYHTFYLGQVNLMLLALILADVWRTSRGRPAGIGIGIAAAVKLTPLIFIPLLFLARRTREGIVATATFVGCSALGYLVAPGDSRLYLAEVCHETLRVGAAYISNQSPYATAIRIAGGKQFVGFWYDAIPLVLGIAGLVIATVLARRDDWLGAATVTGVTGLLVSPVSWTHHWVWILPGLVVLLRGGWRSKIAAAAAYLLFVIAPMWFTPFHGGPGEFGFHGLQTIVANSYLIAGLAFLCYMGRQAYLAALRNAPRRVSVSGARPGRAVPAQADGDAGSARMPERTAAGRSRAAAGSRLPRSAGSCCRPWPRRSSRARRWPSAADSRPAHPRAHASRGPASRGPGGQ